LNNLTKTDTHKKAMITALEKSLGVVTTACLSVGISRESHYSWMKDDPEYAEAVRSIEDIALDFAESQLHKQMKDGNPTSTIFYLKTKGRRRGYTEHLEVKRIEPIEITIIDKIEQTDSDESI